MTSGVARIVEGWLTERIIEECGDPTEESLSHRRHLLLAFPHPHSLGVVEPGEDPQFIGGILGNGPEPACVLDGDYWILAPMNEEDGPWRDGWHGALRRDGVEVKGVE